MSVEVLPVMLGPEEPGGRKYEIGLNILLYGTIREEKKGSLPFSLWSEEANQLE